MITLSNLSLSITLTYMGYTHYFGGTGEKAIKAEAVAIIAPLLEKEHAKGVVALEYNDTDKPPFISNKAISFNGMGEEGHETFSFNIQGEPTFCKTARKQYDHVVCKVLLTLEHFHPKINLGSDGDVDGDGRDEQWSNAKIWLSNELKPLPF